MNTPAPELATCLVGERNGFRWYHVEDVQAPALNQLAAHLGLHDLAIEDCRQPGTRAKVEEYEGHLFIVVNTLHFDPEKIECWFGEFDIFVGKEFVVTVHAGPSRTASAVRPRFAADPKLAHPAKLLHALLHVVVGRYMPVLDSIEERIDAMEDQAYSRPSPKVLSEIFSIRRALIEFRRVCTTMREVANALLTRNEPWLRSHQMYFRDVYDHVFRALDFVDTYRDILTGVLDVHLTATANRTNEVMKILTVFATIATPFLILTGYFGMNFEFMPLIHRPYGLGLGTGLMVLTSLIMLWIFKRRGWF